ncbi:MAG: hypothetical protein MRJ67_03985 [Nitrospirales bacterium]|nr:hypothetical protein [Nitrospira sp.]MDR4459670.1 hypothetical protein [Nitrospirales bacterium]
MGFIQFQEHPLKAAKSAFRIEMHALSSKKLREFIESATGRETEWLSKSWDIDRFTLAAIFHHPDLALARTQAASAEAVSIAAARRPNPRITFFPTWVSTAEARGHPWIVLSASKIPAILVQNLKEIALGEHPDVLAALANYEITQSALQLEIANQYPDIQANPGYAWNLGEHRWTLGEILPVPIFHHNQDLIAKTEAARLLGVHRSRLYVKLKELGIAPEEGTALPEEWERP